MLKTFYKLAIQENFLCDKGNLQISCGSEIRQVYFSSPFLVNVKEKKVVFFFNFADCKQMSKISHFQRRQRHTQTCLIDLQNRETSDEGS